LSLVATAIIVSLAKYVLPAGNLSFIASGAFLFVLYFILLRAFKELRDDDIAPFTKLWNR
jgi:hypothetical protein